MLSPDSPRPRPMTANVIVLKSTLSGANGATMINMSSALLAVKPEVEISDS